MKYIGIDLATKSLAISIIDYNQDFIKEMNDALDQYIIFKNDFITSNKTAIKNLLERFNDTIDRIISILDNRVNVIDMSVVDLIPGNKVSDISVVDRTHRLYNYMNGIFDAKLYPYKPEEMTFLLEYQMGPNVKSNVISSQILYHISRYRNRTGSNIVLVGPSLKNKIMIGGYDSHYSNFVNKYTTLYAANKNHTKYNLQKFLEFVGSPFPPPGIKKANIDDIADAVIMTMAWILKST